MVAFEAVCCVAAALCVSGRGALLTSLLLALSLLLAQAVYGAWERHLPDSAAAAAALTALAVGGALWRALSALSAQNAADLDVPLPLFLLFLLCGLSAGAPPSAGRLWRGMAALLTAGCARELLSVGSLFGYPLIPSQGAVWGNSVGGLLLAAGAVLLWGIYRTQGDASPPRAEELVRLGAFTTVVSAAVWLLQDRLTAPWLFFVIATAGLLIQAACPTAFSQRTVWLPPTLIVLYGVSSPLTALLLGVGCAALWGALTAALDRLSRAHVPRFFAGPPLWLTAAALVTALVGAI